jgi:hypothetical protein
MLKLNIAPLIFQRASISLFSEAAHNIPEETGQKRRVRGDGQMQFHCDLDKYTSLCCCTQAEKQFLLRLVRRILW